MRPLVYKHAAMRVVAQGSTGTFSLHGFSDLAAASTRKLPGLAWQSTGFSGLLGNPPVIPLTLTPVSMHPRFHARKGQISVLDVQGCSSRRLLCLSGQGVTAYTGTRCARHCMTAAWLFLLPNSLLLYLHSCVCVGSCMRITLPYITPVKHEYVCVCVLVVALVMLASHAHVGTHTERQAGASRRQQLPCKECGSVVPMSPYPGELTKAVGM